MSGYQKWAIDIFAGQFQPEGDDYIYRKSMKGAPIRVTAEERRRYITDYEKFFRYSVWCGAGVMILVVIVTSFFFDYDAEASVAMTWIPVLLLMVVYFFASRWAYNAPARDLRDRLKCGAPATRSEVRNAFLRSMSYTQMATIAVMLPVALFSEGSWRKLPPEWRAAPWAGVGILLAVLAFRAYQKRQMERGDTGKSGS